MADSCNEFFTEVGPNINTNKFQSQIHSGNQTSIFHQEFLILCCYTPPLLRKLVKSFIH